MKEQKTKEMSKNLGKSTIFEDLYKEGTSTRKVRLVCDDNSFKASPKYMKIPLKKKGKKSIATYDLFDKVGTSNT